MTITFQIQGEGLELRGQSQYLQKVSPGGRFQSQGRPRGSISGFCLAITEVLTSVMEGLQNFFLKSKNCNLLNLKMLLTIIHTFFYVSSIAVLQNKNSS